MKEVTVERAKAIVTIIVTAVVNVANVMGYALDAEEWVNVALSVLSALTIAYSWWKNQNITEAAVAGQNLIDKLKGEKNDA